MVGRGSKCKMWVTEDVCILSNTHRKTRAFLFIHLLKQKVRAELEPEVHFPLPSPCSAGLMPKQGEKQK